MKKSLIVITLFLILSSCKIKEAITPTLYNTTILQVTLKNSSESINPKMVNESCQLIKERLKTFNFKGSNVKVINNNQLEVSIPKILNREFDPALIVTNEAHFHLVYSEPFTRGLHMTMREIDSVQDAQKEFDELIQNHVTFIPFKLGKIEDLPFIPEDMIGKFQSLCKEEFIVKHMDNSMLLTTKLPYEDSKRRVRLNISGQKLHEIYEVSRKSYLQGLSISTISAKKNPEYVDYAVHMEFDPEGAYHFSRLTRRNIGSLIAVVINNEIFSTIQVQKAERPLFAYNSSLSNSDSELSAQIAEDIVSGALDSEGAIISDLLSSEAALLSAVSYQHSQIIWESPKGGSATITGDFSKTEAERLAIIIGSGKLPYRFEVVKAER